MTEEEIELLQRIEDFGGPGRNQGSMLSFYPTDDFLIELTRKYNVEIACVFTMGKDTHYLWTGTSDSIMLPIKTEPNFEILIKHTHPRGTMMPSIHDVRWLQDAQNIGSPQVKSLILLMNGDRFSFNINSNYLE